jgi:hypothetical protein
MAINLATLKTRSLSALLFLFVMLCGLLRNEGSFLILFFLIHFGCWIEFIKVIKKNLYQKLFTLPFLWITLYHLADLVDDRFKNKLDGVRGL